MQTILGASGQIGRELAVCLRRDFTDDIRLVSRRPQKVDDRFACACPKEMRVTRRHFDVSDVGGRKVMTSHCA